MQRLRFHPLWRPWPLARRTAGWQRSVLLALLGWSLLVAGELGQLHRYAHHPAEGPHSLATAAVRAAAPAATPPVESGPEFEIARAKAEKAIRLASALRANLRRRKAPARTPATPRDSN